MLLFECRSMPQYSAIGLLLLPCANTGLFPNDERIPLDEGGAFWMILRYHNLTMWRNIVRL
jgi:hypothetical protein